MNDIQVAYQGVKVAVDDLDALAGTLTSAQTLVDTYFRVEPGGRFLDDARASVDRIRGQLGTQYSGLSTKVAGASDTIADIWKDFERTDGRARVDFEERRARLGQHPGSGFPDLGEPPDIAPHPPPPPATRCVDPEHLRGYLTDPRADTSVLDLLDDWRAIKDGIDQVLGFEWLVGPLQKVGLHVPLDRFKEQLEGSYVDMAEVAAGLRALGDYFQAASTDVHEAGGQVHGHWLGRTSEAVQGWLGTLSGASHLHGGALSRLANGIQLQAQTAKLIMDQVLDLLGDLADLMPVISWYGESLVERGLHLLEGALHHALHVLSVALRTITKLVLRVELLYDALWVIITLMSSSGEDLTFAAIAAPHAP